MAGRLYEKRPDDLPPELAVPLIPVNIVPNVVVDTGTLLLLPFWAMSSEREPFSSWPVPWLVSPVVGPVLGIADTTHGRPFWRATAPDLARWVTNHREEPPRPRDPEAELVPGR